jgi:16S rRNA (guanine(966)-N(2))-methyltransferase RsmD
MRVIAGKARGIRINAPVGREIRPTLDRVRESLFNIIGPQVGESRFLDLFAGTGAVGLEALSRGAERVTFVDSDVRALKTVRENLARTRMVGQVRCARLTLPREIAEIHGVFDLVFADPPYRFAEYGTLLEAIGDAPFLAPQALVVLEHRCDAEVPEEAGQLQRTRRKEYGDTILSFYASKNQPAE